MNNTNINEIMLEEAYMMNEAYDNIKREQEQWFEEFDKKTKIQKIVDSTKLNISILKSKNISIKDRIFTVIWGA